MNENQALLNEIERLKAELVEKDKFIAEFNLKASENSVQKPVYHDACHSLSNHAIRRYSRQLILPELGVQGQLKLVNSKVLIVGAGGLGCPAAIYLVAAGVGCLGVVDYDEVELSNLHRQILHTESEIGQRKVESLRNRCNSLNQNCRIETHYMLLNSANACDVIRKYDIVLDATDNVATRYLLNDACVLLGRTLVSGSALRWEGQLTVYNHNGGPCYRCLYPVPPPADAVTNCNDGGVVGVVPGIIGCLQALEAIKLTALQKTSLSGKMLLFDALDCSFRSIRIRGRQLACSVCGDNPTVTSLVDYEQFCGASPTDKARSKQLLDAADRVTVQDFQRLWANNSLLLLVDVREPVELDICKLPVADSVTFLNVPMGNLRTLDKKNAKLASFLSLVESTKPNLGNDSQIACLKLKELLADIKVDVKDIVGGLTAWSKLIDQSFPVY